MSPVPLLALAPLVAAALPQSILVDFGDNNLQTGAQVEVWNDVHTKNQAGTHPLVDSTGAATGLQLDFDPSEMLGRIQLQGVLTPAPGSELEALGWPVEATSDGMYSGITPDALEARFTLSGLDPAATVDLTLLASSFGTGELLTTEYTANGAVRASAVLEPAENGGRVVTLAGIAPDATGVIALRVASAGTNTTSERDYYLNALRIEVHAPGSRAPLLGFSTNRIDASRLQGKGAFSGSLDLYTSDLAAPTAALTAVDDATGLPPTWLAVPATGVPGAPFPVGFDPAGLALGAYSATVTAQASGYPAAAAKLTLLVRAPGPLHLLYYGNSWSTGNGGYPTLVELLAAEIGLDVPDSVYRFALGKQTAFHASNAGQIAAIHQLLPLGEEWDWVLTLGSSYEATSSLGNPATFDANVQQVVANVRAHSPGARLCLVQPWARAAGHNIYQGSSPAFSSPLDLHGQIDAAYAQAVASVDALYGPGTAWRARAGETLLLQAFDPALYGQDGAHPGPRTTVTAATTVLAVMVGRQACRMKLDFQTPGATAAHLAGLGLTEADWRAVAGLSDRVAEPSLRRHPGSSEELLLTTGSGAPLDAWWWERLNPGDVVKIWVRSPNGLYAGVPVTIHVDAFRNGSQQGSNPAGPELHFDPQSSWTIAATSALDPAGLTVSLGLGPWMVGRTLVVQAVAQAPSGFTGSPFTATDAHEFRVGKMPMLTPVL